MLLCSNADKNSQCCVESLSRWSRQKHSHTYTLRLKWLIFKYSRYDAFFLRTQYSLLTNQRIIFKVEHSSACNTDFFIMCSVMFGHCKAGAGRGVICRYANTTNRRNY
jgi:hypothetical protein